MLHQLPAASREKCAIAIKAYLEHFARNSNQLGLPVHGLELLRSRLFSATFGHYPGRETPSCFLSFNIDERDTRRFVHHPGSQDLVPVSQHQAAMIDTSFVVLACTDKNELGRAAAWYINGIFQAYGIKPGLIFGESITIEDSFAGKKGAAAPKSIQLFTVIIDMGRA
jgi:hypothetical protein